MSARISREILSTAATVSCVVASPVSRLAATHGILPTTTDRRGVQQVCARNLCVELAKHMVAEFRLRRFRVLRGVLTGGSGSVCAT